MNTPECDRARAALSRVESARDDSELGAILEHIDGCEECRNHPAVLEAYQRLPVEAADLHTIDAVLAQQEADERPMAEAMQRFLGSLDGEAASLGSTLATRHGFYSLYAAQEAFSSTVRRSARRRRPLEGIEFRKSDRAIFFDGHQVFERDTLGLEIARSADLWTEDGARPALDAPRFVDWIALALAQQTRLLRDFEAFEAIEQFWLRELLPSERFDDPYQRWSQRSSLELVALALNQQRELFLVDKTYPCSLRSMERHADYDFFVVAVDPVDAEKLSESAQVAMSSSSLTMRRLEIREQLHLEGERIEIDLSAGRVDGWRVAGCAHGQT